MQRPWGGGVGDSDRDGAPSDLSPCFLPPVSTEKTTQVSEEQFAFGSLTSGPRFHVCGPYPVCHLHPLWTAA